MYAFEAKRSGREFTTAGFDERNAAITKALADDNVPLSEPQAPAVRDEVPRSRKDADALPAVPEGKVRLIGPNGEIMDAPPTKELDTWLKKNSKWKRQDGSGKAP